MMRILIVSELIARQVFDWAAVATVAMFSKCSSLQ